MAGTAKLLERETEYRKTWNGDHLGSMSPAEIFWADHYRWLESQGYKLRPRYHPDWIPTWKKSNKWVLRCEDSVYLPMYVRTLKASQDLVQLTLA